VKEEKQNHQSGNPTDGAMNLASKVQRPNLIYDYKRTAIPIVSARLKIMALPLVPSATTTGGMFIEVCGLELSILNRGIGKEY
jgi:hypothetical protein